MGGGAFYIWDLVAHFILQCVDPLSWGVCVWPWGGGGGGGGGNIWGGGLVWWALRLLVVIVGTFGRVGFGQW